MHAMQDIKRESWERER